MAPGAAWVDGNSQEGEAIVYAGLKRVTVCDFNANDGTAVGIKYATSFLRVIQVQAPQGGCADDSVFFGSITMARFCSGFAGGSFPSRCAATARFS
ncbi:hypothetical protein OHA25_60485 (plasmid) [Nonomuraea sp. NBC_00507]|uniref:hypothetical protein n=1 Tax=Nonomuraea sp. NBC_00507 TaxID=2976002 RepID=UPI002E176868